MHQSMAVYHSFDKEFTVIINKYRTWYEWYVSTDENERKKYIRIDSNRKQILSFRNNTINVDRLEKRDCDVEMFTYQYFMLNYFIFGNFFDAEIKLLFMNKIFIRFLLKIKSS